MYPAGRAVRRPGGGGVRGQPGPERAAAEAGVLDSVLAIEPAQRHRLAAGVRGHPQEPRPRAAGRRRAAAGAAGPGAIILGDIAASASRGRRLRHGDAGELQGEREKAAGVPATASTSGDDGGRKNER
ncbi:hypothetical protein SEVIR_7G247051v4 [Setaria viridis]